ncbi:MULTISPECIES: alpha/beta fold hydrolase [unclassified Amycolatopsis]|uniref:alpha/beta fold hydrolase n=1 Tax=unclassified Amycolatopsis TaxID=2618356 RepID=UPI001C6A0311|nr:alpha/beta hydrolase [Amycolatopsis sp. DSM 110486]QYN20884.1 alpha/beta hydrolase [Amycolatopsis sp. DSM 110486]
MEHYTAPAVAAGLEFTPPTQRAQDAIAAAIARRDAPGKHVFASEKPIANEDGETERLPGGTTVTHRFVDGPGDMETVRWHFVEAGTSDKPVVVFLHGIPDSWYLFHHQITDLAADFRVLSIDLKGYGQSEKSPGDYRHVGVADQLVGLLDVLGIERPSFVTHDRGGPIVDYLASRHPERIHKYVRGEQQLWHWHPDVSPQEKWFTDLDHNPFGDPAELVSNLHAILSTRPVAEEDVRRTIREASHPGIKWAVPRYFQSTTIKKEWIDRRLDLIRTWQCPILVLQGYEDPFQPYEYFEDIEKHIPNSRLAFVGAGHFPPLENPGETSEKIAAFLAG